MEHFDVIVVGAGPAGSSCAGALRTGGARVLLLDREVFPRDKLCAGWITPGVFRLLGASPHDYPHPLTWFRRLHFFIKGAHLPIPTLQYAIRRVEFDSWLLQRSGVALTTHRVREIRRVRRGASGPGSAWGSSWVVDGRFEAEFLVGAGGSSCPVAAWLRSTPSPGDGQGRESGRRIVTMEEEFRYLAEDRRCLLWFFERGLPGYSWYVPKTGGYLTVGLGARASGLGRGGVGIREHWDLLVEKLKRKKLVEGRTFSPRGHSYLLRARRGGTPGAVDGTGEGLSGEEGPKVWLVGDSAGLATLDMGEGIAPAIHSGLSAARSILEYRGVDASALARLPRGAPRSYSFPALFFR